MGMRSKLTDSSTGGPLTADARPLLSLCLKAISARHATHCPCGQLAEHSQRNFTQSLSQGALGLPELLAAYLQA